jgi:hypothetical protein
MRHPGGLRHVTKCRAVALEQSFYQPKRRHAMKSGWSGDDLLTRVRRIVILNQLFRSALG